MSEDQLQQQIIMWYRNEYQMHGKGLIHSTPNGGSRNMLEAKKLKQTGAMAGIADLTIKLPNSFFIDIELKTEKGVLSDVQKKIQNIMINMNCHYYVIRSLEEFKFKIKPIIDKYLLSLNM